MKFTISLVAFSMFVFFALASSNACQMVKVEKPSSNYKSIKDSSKTEIKKTVTKENIGIGPIKELKLGPINKTLVSEGKSIFNNKCFACHRLDTKLVGPALLPIVKKTSPVYLMNYLLNTTEMQAKEPELKKLIKEYNGIAMPDQYLNKKQARAVLEYLRSEVK